MPFGNVAIAEVDNGGVFVGKGHTHTHTEGERERERERGSSADMQLMAQLVESNLGPNKLTAVARIVPQ